MVLLDIPLDAATVMIASVAIGIADDDTIHFLSCFRREKRAGRDTLTAIHNSFQNAGRAITFTSVVSASGFAILLLAEFRPIQYFGLLAGLTMITGWMGDVFVLPACVASLNLWNGRVRREQTQ
jgi:predicted RND superfamily exporter protein